MLNVNRKLILVLSAMILVYSGRTFLSRIKQYFLVTLMRYAGVTQVSHLDLYNTSEHLSSANYSTQNVGKHRERELENQLKASNNRMSDTQSDWWDVIFSNQSKRSDKTPNDIQCAHSMKDLDTELSTYYSISTETKDLHWSWENLNNFHVTSVLDTPRPVFLPNFRSPCWLQETEVSSLGYDLRCGPTFFLAGMPKCGTTALWKDLVSHPKILAANYKEAHYWARGIRVDGSCSTFWDYHLMSRTRSTDKDTGVTMADVVGHILPNSLIMVILRDPVERLYSDYLNFCWNITTSPQLFHELAVKGVALMKQCFRANSTQACAHSMRLIPNTTQLNCLRLHVGMYVVFVRDWISVFPASHLHVMRMEDYVTNKTQTLRSAAKFLDLDPDAYVPLVRRRKAPSNGTGVQRLQTVKGDMLSTTRGILREFYAPFNHELSKFLRDDKYTWGY